MVALATEVDVASRLGRALDGDEIARVQALLLDASAAVRSYVGQTFEAGEGTDRLRVRGNRVRLTRRPVTAVDSVEDMVGNELEFIWYAGDTVELVTRTGVAFAFETVPRSTPLRYVDVTYTAGYAAVPDDIVGVVSQMAARALGAPLDEARVTAQSVGDASQSYGSMGRSGAFGLEPDERDVLDRYRRLTGPIRIG